MVSFDVRKGLSAETGITYSPPPQFETIDHARLDLFVKTEATLNRTLHDLGENEKTHLRRREVMGCATCTATWAGEPPVSRDPVTTHFIPTRQRA